MKNFIAFILSLVLVSFSFAGCGSKQYDKYTSLIEDKTSDGNGIHVESKIWTGEYFTKKFMRDKNCTVMGKSYSGSYEKSIVNKINSYTTDVYYDEDYIEFGLREDNGELAYVNLMNSEFHETQPFWTDVSNPSEFAISFATEIAKQYVDNLDEYVRLIEDPKQQYKEKDGKRYEITYYVVTFARKINGYFSSDYISIKVTSKGTLASIWIGDLNAFKDLSIEFDTAILDQSIMEKVESAYTSVNFKIKKKTIEEQKIAVTPSGDICMYSRVAVEGTNAENREANSGVVILTLLGKRRN